jgi:VWFA-related protein
MRFLSLVLALCLAGSIPAGHAQRPDVILSDPQPMFHAAVDLVRIDVSVLDQDRLPVRGLTAADFTVLEDGKVQPIVAFDAVDLPDWSQAGAPWMRDVAPDPIDPNVITNRFAAQRVIVIILKDVLVPLDPWATRTTKQIARDIIDHMGPEDAAAVVYTFKRNNGQEFTTDRARLLAAVDRFSVSFGDQLLTLNPFSASERGRQSDRFANANDRKPGPAPEVCPKDECVTMALRNASEILRGWPGGRKTVVLVSPFMHTVTMESRGSLTDDLRQTYAAMQEANVNVYQFDPRGLMVAPAVHSDEFGTFADETGGRAITNTNTPWTLVPQMFRENGSYYLLGFRSTDTSAEGRFHRLTVRVARPEVEVRARAGYYGPRLAKTTTAGRKRAVSPLGRSFK